MVLKSAKPQIAVIGAGVVGLSTANCIQQTIQSVNVSIFADKFLEETLSYGAGGLFRPEVNIGESLESIEEWSKNSYTHYTQLALSRDANQCGMQMVSGYQLSSYGEHSLQNHILDKLIPSIRNLTESEKNMFDKKFRHGIYWTTIVTDPRYYLPWLTKQFSDNGGLMIHRHIENLNQLYDYDVIVNCSGLSAKYLVNDWKITAVRGQTIKVKAPWIKHFYYGDDAYVIPGVDYVTCGGIKEYGDWNTNLKEHDRHSIWQRCTQLVPSLSNAHIVSEWVGLRPQRQPVRVESQIVESNANHTESQLKVVHNYGHGGHGISLSWGTARYATDLVRQLLSQQNLTSKL